MVVPILHNVEKILVPHFSADEIGQIKKIFSETDENQLISRPQVDLLITYAQNKLSQNKLIQFLITLGEAAKNNGEYDIALDIFDSLLKTASNNSNLSNIKINCFLALADIYEKQAYWKESLALVKKAKNAFTLKKR